ncbi:MAG: 2-amino-4-hydroxy-6-hydroxymethyldihydropteridine diphosphokinase [Gemmatimonadota bacterium]|nr:2-amino-4-hydroxy-6-hydroxymethyldihydropteridine diphosphokinase [Gemmatimonadota bacterium]
MTPRRNWAFVSLGSNLGDRAKHLAHGRRRLVTLPQSELVAMTPVEETAVIGEISQGSYLNQMLLLATELSPRELLEHCHTIEAETGRIRGERWGPRTLDLDIVRFGDDIVSESDLQIPHPELAHRPFWQRELALLAPHTQRRRRSGEVGVPEVAHVDVDVPGWAKVKRKRRLHIARVAALLAHWADRMAVEGPERDRWQRAAAYHDALKDAPLSELRALSPGGWDVDVLRHGPAAAAVAATSGETDQSVLDAVRYHSVGYAGWDQVGRMLYLADFLEPARKREPEDHAALRVRVPADADTVLCEVARRRLEYQVRHGRSLLPETSAFWESLACDG